MYRTTQEMESLLANLSESMPRLLQENQSSEFWTAFLQRADAIKKDATLDQLDWVTERIHEILANYGISPPARWLLSLLTQTA